MKTIKKLIIFLSMLSISSCSTLDSVGKILTDSVQAGIYKEYISNKSKTKVLVVSSLPTTRVVNMFGVEEISSVNSKRYYFSTEQASIEIAIIEALEYCRIDSSWNDKKENNCEVAMVLDFNANEVEREFGKFVLSNIEDHLEITIKNINFDNDCKFDSVGVFRWKGCSTKVRYKVELPKSYFRHERV